MDSKQAAENLEVIRTLMERATQYQLLTARAGLAAGVLAGAGAGAFLFLDPADPREFGTVWGLVFVAALVATSVSTVVRGRQQGERIWSRQARAVVFALLPSLFAALVLSVFFFARGEHLWLPGVWMLCYGQGALATAAYAPKPIGSFGIAALGAGGVTLALGPAWAIPMMGLVFGVGHLALGVVMLVMERRQLVLRVHRSVA
jgi:hypothetical protein